MPRATRTPEVKWATHGLMFGARQRPTNHFTDPVAWADAACTTNDWRIALCIALGVDLKHIHPGTGHNLTPRRAKQLELDLGAIA